MVLTDLGLHTRIFLAGESLPPQIGWSSGHRCCCCGCMHPECGDSTFQLESHQRFSLGSPEAHFFHRAAKKERRTRGLPLSVLPHRCISARAAESAAAELARAPRGCHGNQEQAPTLVAGEGCGGKVMDKR